MIKKYTIFFAISEHLLHIFILFFTHFITFAVTFFFILLFYSLFRHYSSFDPIANVIIIQPARNYFTLLFIYLYN